MKLFTKAHGVSGRFAVRLVAGLLVVSLPATVVLAVLLTRSASNSISTINSAGGENVARAVALRAEDWLSERNESLLLLTKRVSGGLNDLATAAEVSSFTAAYDDFTNVEV